jgi:uncharacterized protein YjeT (DUF2065 family)
MSRRAMNELAKILIIAGCVLIAVGLVVFVLARIPGLGRLPGDILIRRENFTFYVPLATSLLLSLVLSGILYFLNRK